MGTRQRGKKSSEKVEKTNFTISIYYILNTTSFNFFHTFLIFQTLQQTMLKQSCCEINLCKIICFFFHFMIHDHAIFLHDAALQLQVR